MNHLSIDYYKVNPYDFEGFNKKREELECPKVNEASDELKNKDNET